MSARTYGRDLEIVHRMRPEPFTDREARAQDQIDDTEFEIFKHKMHMIALEGKETTMKLGASTAMRWGDVAFGIFTGQGDLSVCATGIYHHAVLGQIPLKYIVKHWVDEASVGCKPGDSFFYNDPFYAGVHNADMGLSIPVFYEGQLLCFVGAAVHTGECGGSEPGGTVTAARSKYDEGMIVPPIKVGENYQLKEDLLGMFAAMNRDPRTMILDIKARLAAARIVERRILEVVEQKGVDFFLGALRRILSQTGAAAKKKVASMNDGVFRQVRFLDTLGEDSGLVKIDLKVEKKGSEIKFNLEGSSPALIDRPANSFFQGVIGLSMVYFCGWLFHDLPTNNGLLEAIDWEFPENSLINATGDISTSIAPLVQLTFTHGMFQCGARMSYSTDPSRAVASWFAGFSIPTFGGLNQFGEPVADITPEINATGCGGRCDMDGVDAAGAFFATMADCSDAEATEADRPFIYTFRNYFDNSYGHGKHRGGAGVGYGLAVHDTNFFMLGSHGGGAKFPTTQGLFGGYGLPSLFVRRVAQSNYKTLLADSNQALPARLTDVFEDDNPEEGAVRHLNISAVVSPAQDGDTFYSYAGGGAGFGDPIERDPESVLTDLRAHRVSAWAARNIYYIVFDEEHLRLDAEATRRRRQAVRDGRIARGKSWREFNKEWLAKRPPSEILTYYGDYPSPQTKSAKSLAAELRESA